MAEFSIGPYETAELLAYSVGGYSSGGLFVIKDGITNHFIGANAGGSPATVPLVVAGPATFRMVVRQDGNSFTDPDPTGLCTFRVSPEPFPPDRTVIVPPGTNQTQITLECSTNLVHWFAANNGVYGPLPEAKFFRIKLERQ